MVESSPLFFTVRHSTLPAWLERSSAHQDRVLVRPLQALPEYNRNILGAGIVRIPAVVHRLVLCLLRNPDEVQEGTPWSICDRSTSRVLKYHLMVHLPDIHRGTFSSWPWEMLAMTRSQRINLRIPWTIYTTVMLAIRTVLYSCGEQCLALAACPANPLPRYLPHKWLSIRFGIRLRQYENLLLQSEPSVGLDGIPLGSRCCCFRFALSLRLLQWESRTL